jgi:hypothetical protein
MQIAELEESISLIVYIAKKNYRLNSNYSYLFKNKLDYLK